MARTARSVVHPGVLGLGRRDFLRIGAGAGAAGLAGLGVAPRATGGVRGRGGTDAPQARNLIFMVADGMSFGTLTIADTVTRMRDGKASAWCSLWEREGVRRTMQQTFCADALVTDSAAAAAAWGSGQACNTGVLNITPEGKQYLPILVHARQNGKATGLVTTTRVTHATPAGFSVNCPHRDLEDAIAVQQLERQIDLMLGGGAQHFPDDLLAKHPGLSVVRTKAELASPKEGKRLLGLFGSGHVAHVLDRGPDIPSLEEMAGAALARLGKASDGFVLQIEGGRVDHAAHDNDAASLVQEQLEFDRTLAKVLSWMEGRDDTLLVVTTDHGNANPGLTLYGKRGAAGLERLLQARRSFEKMFGKISAAKKQGGDLGHAVAEIVEEGTGVALEGEELAMLTSSLTSHRVMPFRDANSPVCVLGSLLASVYGVGFVSPNHTSDMVELTSFGPGSQKMRPVMRNRDVWAVVVEALGFAPAQLLEGMDRVVRLKGIEGD